VKRGETRLISPRKERRLALRVGQEIDFPVVDRFKAANSDRAPHCTMLVAHSDKLVRLCICNAEDEYPEMAIFIDVTRSRGGKPQHMRSPCDKREEYNLNHGGDPLGIEGIFQVGIH
jgi:hypothetical protein